MTQSKSRVVSISSRTPKARATPSKLFVLDTNVLMHDPTSLYRFEEHDIFLPICTLEELDNHKKGTLEVNRNARQASRFLDGLVGGFENGIAEGIPLNKASQGGATGRLFLQTEPISVQLPSSFAPGKADNEIIAVCLHLQKKLPKRHIVLVSKDINMRIKARALNVDAEDYFNDKVLEDSDLLYTGMTELPADFWEKHGKGVESWQQGGATFYKITGPIVPKLLVNEFVYTEIDTPFYARVIAIEGKSATLQTLRDFGHHKNAVWGITARNREQNFAMNLLMNPDVDFVTLLGQAGTGKTLLTLAAGLQLTLDQKIYNEIIMTRVTVPVGEDIGFLPGTEEEKMTPWMGALEDNLDVLMGADNPTPSKKRTESLCFTKNPPSVGCSIVRLIGAAPPSMVLTPVVEDHVRMRSSPPENTTTPSARTNNESTRWSVKPNPAVTRSRAVGARPSTVPCCSARPATFTPPVGDSRCSSTPRENE